MENIDLNDIPQLEQLIADIFGITDCTDIVNVRLALAYNLERLMKSYQARTQAYIDGCNKDIDSLNSRLAKIDEELATLVASKGGNEPEEEITTEEILEDKSSEEEIVTDELPKEELTTDKLPEEALSQEKASDQSIEIDDSINARIRELKKEKTELLEKINELKKIVEKTASSQVAHKKRYEKILNEINNSKDLDDLIKRCIAYKIAVLQSIDAKTRIDDSKKDSEQKIARRREAQKLGNVLLKMPSVSKYILNGRQKAKYIDEKTIIPFHKDEPTPSAFSFYPINKLDITFVTGPKGFSGIHGKVLDEAGIYTYVFGTVTHSLYPNDQGRYTQEFFRKTLVAVVKRDEIDGEIKTYAVLMEPFNINVPPEFYRDVVFSDSVLKNAENNLGLIGEIARDPKDRKYGYKLEYDVVGLEDFMRALYFEKNPDFVKITSNYPKVRSVADARKLMLRKMREALERSPNRNNGNKNRGKLIGED